MIQIENLTIYNNGKPLEYFTLEQFIERELLADSENAKSAHQAITRTLALLHRKGFLTLEELRDVVYGDLHRKPWIRELADDDERRVAR